MALTCLDEDGSRVQAFDLNEAEWLALQLRNRQERHLCMPCCSASVVMKRSTRGTPFFSHWRIGVCTTGDESEEHRHLKLLAIEAARACGWEAEAEVTGSTPAGEQWRADVLAHKGNARVAVEIQWSGQVESESLRRQRQYQDSGVRGLWLLRQPKFPVTQDLPAVCVGGSLQDGFSALLPHHGMRMRPTDRATPGNWRQTMSLSAFLRAAFSKRLKWGTPIDAFARRAEVAVKAAEALCWHESCGVFTDIITRVIIANPGMTLEFTLADLNEFPALADRIIAKLPDNFDFTHIKRRYSRTLKRSYLSNGCVGCDRIYGDFHVHEHWQSEVELARFPIQLSGQWLQLAQSRPEIEKASSEWWVIPSE